MPLRRIIAVGVCVAALFIATAGAAERARILLIPLDDRPPCLQFTQMIGEIGQADVVAPPRSLLGRFTEAGRPDEIKRWIDGQKIEQFDAAIISLDMLAYGGLVNSRVNHTSLDVALGRLKVLRDLKARAPRLPVYGFNVIMRLAPTADGRNESYRAKLTRWAELSPSANDNAQVRAEVQKLESEIPAAALVDYKNARARNFAVNEQVVELVRSGVIDYLIFAQDDAKPRGVHVADRERLITAAQKNNLAEKIAVQPGADEVSMLLLARALNRKHNRAPRVAAVYSSETVRTSVAPFEDRPLHRTVSFHIAAAGARETASLEQSDLVFFVYGSRAEPGAAERFAAAVARSVAEGRRVIVADIDFKGDVQGGDPQFTEALRRRQVFPRLAGYAAWNTAGNTIGTALPHGLVFAVAADQAAAVVDQSRAKQISRAQAKFLLHRLIDDYAYHSLVRPAANRFVRSQELGHKALSDRQQALLENFIRERLRPHVTRLWREFARNAPPPLDHGAFAVAGLSNFRLHLPWGRTFEAEIDFELKGRG